MLPRLESTTILLLAYVLESMTRLLHPSSDIDTNLVSNIFEVQKKSLRILGRIKTHLMAPTRK